MNEKGWKAIFVLPAYFSIELVSSDQVLEGLPTSWGSGQPVCVHPVDKHGDGEEGA